MGDWRAIVVGISVFLVQLVTALAAGSELLIFVLGFPCGFTTGFIVGKYDQGGVYAFLTGLIGGGILFAVGYSITTGAAVAPGVGIVLGFLFVFSIVVVIQSTFAGLLGVLLRRVSSM